MGLRWHSEKLNVLLFHLGGQEVAFYTTTTTLPCRTTMDALEMGTLKPTPEMAHPFPRGLPPTSSCQFLCESVGYQVHIWWLNENVHYFAPEGKPRDSRASPPPARGTGRLSAIAERGWPLRDSSSKSNSSHGKTLLPGTESSGRGFYQGSSLDMYSPRFLQMVQGGVRFVGRAAAHNRIIIFKLFLLQPDAGCPFFPGGQPLLPKAWCAGKPNPTCSILFSARGGK